MTRRTPTYVKPYSMEELKNFMASDAPGWTLPDMSRDVCGDLLRQLGPLCIAWKLPGYHRAMSALLHLWKGGTLVPN